jgi:hypothetical protein
MAEHTKLNFDWSKAVCWPTGNEPKQSFDFDGPTPAVAGLTEPEVLPIDQLGRADTAKFLTELAKIKKAGYVLNLNCPWGTGKTWFLKRWLLTLQNQHPVVYIDAWKYDHNDSPLLIILQHIIKTLQEQSPQAKRLGDKIKTSKGFATAKVLGPELVKAVFRVDLEKVMNSADFEATKSASVIADLASKTTALLLDNVSKETEAVDDLKMAIAKLLDSIIGQKAKTNLNYPLFVFVDELDRCRPTFAIEMLEAIKHVFGIPQIFFVIATDSEQLQHSINAVYGEKFGSYNYLKRFFDASFQLAIPVARDFILAQPEFELIYSCYQSDTDIYVKEDKIVYSEIIASIAHDLALDLRTIKQWLSRLEITLKLSLNEIKNLPFMPIVLASAIQAKSTTAFKAISRQKADISTIQSILKPLFGYSSSMRIIRQKMKPDTFTQSVRINPQLKDIDSQPSLNVMLYTLSMSIKKTPEEPNHSHNYPQNFSSHSTIQGIHYNQYFSLNKTLMDKIDALLEMAGKFNLEEG